MSTASESDAFLDSQDQRNLVHLLQAAVTVNGTAVYHFTVNRYDATIAAGDNTNILEPKAALTSTEPILHSCLC